MNEKRKGNGLIDTIFVLMLLVLYVRTADVLSYFSPQILNDVFGFDVSQIYGGLCAFAIEGVIAALHFDKRANGYTPAQFVMWSLVGISLVCQIYDGFITTGSLALQSDTLKAVFSYGVPAIPVIIVIMLVKMGSLPEGGNRVTWLDNLKQRGIRNSFDPLKQIWNGSGNASEMSTTFASETKTAGSGKKSKSRNPQMERV